MSGPAPAEGEGVPHGGRRGPGLRARLVRMLLNGYRGRVRRGVALDPAHCLAAARATVRRTRYAFLVTAGGDGRPAARWVEPMQEPGDGFVFWIGTGPGLRKVRELRADPRVTLAFGNAREHATLVVYGTATVSDDLALRRRWWRPAWRLFFPGGPAGDDYVVVRVQPERMELMSFRRRVVPEPFGLRPVVLERRGDGWAVAG